MRRILGLVRLKISIRKSKKATGISQAEAQGGYAGRPVRLSVDGFGFGFGFGIGRSAEHAFAEQGLFGGVGFMPLDARIGVGASQGGLIGVRFSPFRCDLKHGVKRHEGSRARSFAAGAVKSSVRVADAGKIRVLVQTDRSA
ncbi:MAG: hypothetical protein EBY24_01830 [Betaproteobacteria bacterium]|nr:hypothetical protein [Betaproteobacteria bacterium]